MKPTKQELEEEYKKYGSTASSLSRKYGVTPTTIRNWLTDYKIQKKTHKQAFIEHVNFNKIKAPDPDELHDLHFNQNFSIDDLERKFNVGQNTIYEWFKVYDITPRTLSQSLKFSLAKKYDHIRFSKSTIENYLKIYQENRNAVATELNVSISHVNSLIRQYDIKTQSKTFKSKGELELLNFCKKISPDLTWISGDKSIINPFEIDIYCPEKKLAIEYCGLYWHSENFGQKDKSYHRTKYLKCKEKNIELITVFEKDDMHKVQSLIKKKLGLVDKVYGRQCILQEIDQNLAAQFHRRYHLNGTIGSTVNLGLFHSDQLVLVSSFSKSRFNSQFEWECTRCTTHPEISVIGGVSKLFKHFYESFNVVSCITYADLRFGEGKVYDHCLMNRLDDTPPNYFYFHKDTPTETFSRVKFQKHKLKSILKLFDNNKTEYDNMKINGWDRIWDCGNAKYVFIKA